MKVVVFDLVETLLDLRPLDSHFKRAFGNVDARKIWFGSILQIAFTQTITGEYKNFAKNAEAALTLTAAQMEKQLKPADRAAITKQLETLPLHPDVIPALTMLRDNDIRCAVLTNSTRRSALQHLTAASASKLFEAVLSVDQIKRYKPAPEAYLHAANKLGVGTSDILLVAAHGWDVAGAMAAGCNAAFVARPGKTLNPLQKKPKYVVDDLLQLARKLT